MGEDKMNSLSSKGVCWLILVLGVFVLGLYSVSAMSDADYALQYKTGVGNSLGSILLKENTCEIMSPYCYQVYRLCNKDKEDSNLADNFRVYLRDGYTKLGAFTPISTTDSAVSLGAKNVVNKMAFYSVDVVEKLVDEPYLKPVNISHNRCFNWSGANTNCTSGGVEASYDWTTRKVLRNVSIDTLITDPSKFIIFPNQCRDVKVASYVYGKVDLVVEYQGYKAQEYAIWSQIQKGWTVTYSTNGINYTTIEWNSGGFAQGRRSNGGDTTFQWNFGLLRFDTVNESGTVYECELRLRVTVENGDDTHDIVFWNLTNKTDFVGSCTGGGATCANFSMKEWSNTVKKNQIGNYTGTMVLHQWVNFSISKDYCQGLVDWMTLAGNATKDTANKALFMQSTATGDEAEGANNFVQFAGYDVAVVDNRSHIVITYLIDNHTTITNTRNLTVTNVTALIAWTTDKEVNGTVYYGVEGYGNRTGHTTLNTSHTILLSNLNQGTTYVYRVESCTEKQVLNCTTDNSTFTTPYTLQYNGNNSPIIKLFRNGTSTNVSIVISWETDKPANSSLCYGTLLYSSCVKNSTLAYNHSFFIGSLSPYTAYKFNGSSCVWTEARSGNCSYELKTINTAVPDTGGFNAMMVDWFELYRVFITILGLLIVVGIMSVIVLTFFMSRGVDVSGLLYGIVLTITLTLIVIAVGILALNSIAKVS